MLSTTQITLALLQISFLRIASATSSSASQPHPPTPLYPASSTISNYYNAPNPTAPSSSSPPHSWSTHAHISCGSACAGLPSAIPSISLLPHNGTNTTFHSPNLSSTSSSPGEEESTTVIALPTLTPVPSATDQGLPSEGGDSPTETGSVPEEPLFTSGARSGAEVVWWKWKWSVGVMIGGLALGI